METRLKGVEVTLKMHLKVLKSKRVQQLALISEQRAAVQSSGKSSPGLYVHALVQ